MDQPIGVWPGGQVAVDPDCGLVVVGPEAPQRVVAFVFAQDDAVVLPEVLGSGWGSVLSQVVGGCAHDAAVAAQPFSGQPGILQGPDADADIEGGAGIAVIEMPSSESGPSRTMERDEQQRVDCGAGHREMRGIAGQRLVDVNSNRETSRALPRSASSTLPAVRRLSRRARLTPRRCGGGR